MTDFGSKARSAVIWNTGFNLFRDLLQFGTMLVLVRLLRPESYGEFAMVTSILGFLSIFSHHNFIVHILQVKDEADAPYQEHFTASSVLQVGIFLITNLVALSLHWVPTYAPIAPFLHVMSINFLLEWPCELRRKMIERDFDWQRLRLLQAIGLIGSTLLALVMAWLGAGTYALLVPGMTLTLPFIYDLFVIERWRPTWSWSWDRYRAARQFGLARISSGLAINIKQLMESSVLAAVTGFAMLGIFGRAVGLARLFCHRIASELMNSIYPILTRINGHEGDLARVGGLVLRLVAWATVPIAVVLAALAEPAVQVIYGKNWEDVTPLLPWAMAWGGLAAITHAAYMLLLVRNQTRLCFHADLGILIGTAIALLFALPHGLVVYLIMICCLQMISVVILTISLKKFRALSTAGIFDAFAPPLLASLIAWGALRLIVASGYDGDVSSVLVAVAWGAVFSVLYIATLRIGFSRQLTELASYLPARGLVSRILVLKYTR